MVPVRLCDGDPATLKVCAVFLSIVLAVFLLKCPETF